MLFRQYLDKEPVIATSYLLDGLRDGAVTVLDVRPPDEYAAAHIPGAISMPFGEIEQRLDELPSDGEIVAYCRGPYCIYAVRSRAWPTGRGEGDHRRLLP